MQNYPLARELVLVGGGHSHVLFLRMLGMKPVPGLAVTLISPEPTTPYSGMLPGVIAGHYSPEEAFIELGPLCRFAGANFIIGEVNGLNADDQLLHINRRPSLRYDILSLDVGSTPLLNGVTEDQVIPVKPISTFLSRWDDFLSRLEYGVEQVGFVGSGAGGVELCLAVNHYLKQHAERPVDVHLFTADDKILAEFDDAIRDRFKALMAERGISLHHDFRAASVSNGTLISTGGQEVELDEIFWVTQAAAQPWLADSGLSTSAAGFIQVRDTLQTVSHENVFASGDCATMVDYPRPKAGVFAVRQGKPLFNNIQAYTLGKRLKAFKPQSDYLALISTGDQYAVATRNGYTREGVWVWRWKNWIDTRFMAKFSNLPVMHEKPVNALQDSFEDQMHCGGCGSKVSLDVLSDVIAERLPEHDPLDDAALVEIPEGRQLIQSVDHFRGFVNDPYQQARVAVSHALSDIYACGGTAHSVMAMMTLPFGKPDVVRSLLDQVMAGTVDQLKHDHVKLIGGHTSEGMELSIGFTVNGSVAKDGMWKKSGLREGDLLVTNKPLGVGTLFAADMQFKARGAWIQSAVETMMESNKAACQILHQYDVSACTDITGFGLAGHCLEMLEGNAGVELYLKSVPVLVGAMTCLTELGIKSTLHDANKLATGMSLPDHQSEILYDPQTSGGLLAGIAPQGAEDCINDLRRAGYHQAAVIGQVTDTGRIILNLSEPEDG